MGLCMHVRVFRRLHINSIVQVINTARLKTRSLSFLCLHVQLSSDIGLFLAERLLQ